jgi:hypothetical protein
VIVALVALVATVGLVAPAAGVSEDTFKCEAGHLAALNKWGARRGRCLVRCQLAWFKGHDERVCVDDADPMNAPAFDLRTLRCVDRATQSYLKQAIAACPADAYPSCGTYDTDVVSHVQGEVNVNVPRIDPTTVPLFVCDAAEVKCEKNAVKALGDLSIAFGRCLTACARAQQLGGEASRQCLPTDGTFEGVDPTTGLCLDAARAKTARDISRACPGLPGAPGCGIYPLGLDAMQALVEDFIAQDFLNPFCAP